MAERPLTDNRDAWNKSSDIFQRQHENDGVDQLIARYNELLKVNAGTLSFDTTDGQEANALTYLLNKKGYTETLDDPTSVAGKKSWKKQETKQAPEVVREAPFSSGEMLRTLYTTGVDQLWIDQNGSQPNRDSAEYKAFSDQQLSGIDFQNRQDWQKNAEKEKALSEAANRRLKSL